jgi:hypothetical protein
VFSCWCSPYSLFFNFLFLQFSYRISFGVWFSTRALLPGNGHGTMRSTVILNYNTDKYASLFLISFAGGSPRLAIRFRNNGLQA